jgi:hypothetical protein
MKPTTYRAGVQELVAVGVDSWQATLASAGGGLSQTLSRREKLGASWGVKVPVG